MNLWPLKVKLGGGNFLNFWLAWRGIILQGRVGRFRWFRSLAWNPLSVEELDRRERLRDA